MTQPPRRRLGACLFALLFSVYLLTFSGIYHSSDEMAMLAATDSLTRRGTVEIDLLRWMGQQQGSFGPDGHLYSRKGIGTTLAAAPLYWLALRSRHLGNVQTAMLLNAMVTATTGVLILRLLQRLGYRDGAALGTVLAFGLGTMAWPYARYLFSESLAGLGLLGSAYGLVRSRDRRDAASLLLAGAGLGLALLARLNNAIVAPFLGLLLLAILHGQGVRGWRAWAGAILLFGLPVLAALAVSGGYNWLRFGDVWTTGYLAEERFSTPFWQGLYGLTFSPGKGLFWYNPLLLAALVAWPAFLRRHRAIALLSAAVVMSNIAFYAPWYLWWAGHSWGPRFLVAALPFAALPLAPALESACRRPVRGPAVVLAAVSLLSVAVQVLGVAVDFNLYLEEIYSRLGLYHPATLFQPAYSPLWRQIAYLRPENLDLAWARRGQLDALALFVAVALVAAAGLALAAACRRRWPSWAGAGLLLLLALGTGWLLTRYAPRGSAAEAAYHLAAMEQPGEGAVLADPLLTEPFQDAYDGRLGLWGEPDPAGLPGGTGAAWVIGARGGEPAVVRLQFDQVRLELRLPPGQVVETARLPVPPLPDGGRLGELAELMALKIEDTDVRPGSTLAVTLYWRALASTQTSYTTFLQLIDPHGVKAGQIDRLPCQGECPTTGWRPGDLIGERYELALAGDARPGQYQLIAGMYNLPTGQHLPAWDARGNPAGSYLGLGTITVRP